MSKRVFLLILVLVLAMALALGGCRTSSAPEAEDEPVAEEPAAENPGSGQSGSVGKDDPGDSSGPNALMFPEYADNITWNVIPLDFVGGFGTSFDPKNEGAVVNIREKPSIDSEVVAQIRQGNEEWWIFYEIFEDADGFHIGSYSVVNGDYTWLLASRFVESTGDNEFGWVAQEVIELWAI